MNSYQLICIYQGFIIIGFLLRWNHIIFPNLSQCFFSFLQESQEKNNMQNKYRFLIGQKINEIVSHEFSIINIIQYQTAAMAEN